MPGILTPGSQISVVPTAPDIGNPAAWAAQPERNLAAANAGLAYQQQLADLQNKQANRELESVKIKAAKAQNDLDLALITHAQENLPLIKQNIDTALAVQAATAKEQQDQAASRAGIGATLGNTELANAKVGATNAATANITADTAASQALAAQRATASMTPAQIIEMQANAKARGEALGAINYPVSFPQPLLAPTASAAVAPTGTPAPTVFDDLNQPLSKLPPAPVVAVPVAATAATAPEVVASAAATPGSIEAIKHTAITGLPVRGSSGNPVLDSIIARMEIPNDLARSQAMQTSARELLKQYVVPQEIQNKFLLADGFYDVQAVQAYIDTIKNLQPKTTYGHLPGFNDHYDKAAEIKLTQDFSKNQLPQLLQTMGDPSAFAKTVEQMRNTDPSKGYLMKTLTNYAASNTPPAVATRATVIDYLDNRYQTVLNNTDVGRKLKNSLVASPKDTNATILSTVSALDPLLSAQYDLEKRGYPPEAFQTLENGSAFKPMTPGALVEEHTNAAKGLSAANPFSKAPTNTSPAPAAGPLRYNGAPGHFEYHGNVKYWVFDK